MGRERGGRGRGERERGGRERGGRERGGRGRGGREMLLLTVMVVVMKPLQFQSPYTTVHHCVHYNNI